MQGRSWRERAQDILEAIARIEQYTATMSAEEFYLDTKTSDAVIRNLEIVGEAARELSVDPAAPPMDAPWDLIRGMRNVLAHAYFRVDLALVWKTARDDLASLKAALTKGLGS